MTGQSPLSDPRRWLALGTAFFMVTRTDDLLAGGDQSVDPAFAITEGFQTAFLVASGIARRESRCWESSSPCFCSGDETRRWIR